MKATLKNISGIAIIVLAVMPTMVWAEKLSVGDYNIDFDQKYESDINKDGKNDRTSYYLNGQLVFTAYDENSDGKQDLWLRFKNGDTVDLELKDKNSDGQPDTVTEINPQEKAEVIFDTKQPAASGGWLKILGVIVVIAGAAIFFGKQYLNKVANLNPPKNS